MNFPPQSFGEGILLLAFMSAALLLLALVCRHLRARGYGPVLDAIAARMEQAQLATQRFIPLLGLSAMRGLHSMPLLGSRRQRELLEQLERAERRQLDDEAARQRQL